MRESSAAPRCQLGLRWELPRCRLHQRYGHRRHGVMTSRRPARIRRNARDREQRDEKESLVCTAVRSADTRGLCQARAGPCGRRTSRRVAEPRPASPSWARGVPRLWAVVTTLRELVGVDAARREGPAPRTPRKALCWPSAPWGRPGRRGEPLGGRGALPGAAGTFPDETQTMAARRRVCPVPPIHSVQLKRLIVCP